jgi:hypothetical protein
MNYESQNHQKKVEKEKEIQFEEEQIPCHNQQVPSQFEHIFPLLFVGVKCKVGKGSLPSQNTSF